MAKSQTVTGGRAATEGCIPGDVAISVGRPAAPCPDGFAWRPLSELARLETGHTPSRREPAYWDGEIPWVGIRDATGNHGRTIDTTTETISELGEQNSSTRLLPAETVCLSRTASVGYVVVMGRPMCTSQDFVNWVCGPDLDYRYLKYALLAERAAFLRFASGTTHQTIYFPEVKAFHIHAPAVREQRAIAEVLGALDDKIESNRRTWDVASELLECVVSVASTDGEVVSLDAIAGRNERKVQPGHDLQPLRYVDISSVSRGCVEHIANLRWTDAPSRARRAVRDGDILFSTVRPGRRAYSVVFDPPDNLVASTGFCVLTPRPGWLSVVLAAVGSRPFADYCESAATGSAYPVVSPEAIASFELRVPDDAALARVEAQMQPILRLAYRRLVENNLLCALRDTLLPELLSGRLRVSDAEKAVEAAV